MKKLILLACCGLLMAACGNSGQKNKEAEKAADTTPLFDLANMPDEPVFIMETTKGKLTFKLYADTPLHRENFAKLIHERYFEGIQFHRIIPGFMIQAGDPRTKDITDLSAYTYTTPAEILPQYTHKRGVLAAAHNGNPQKASSSTQFYIVHTDDGAKHLDGQHTVFGEVIDGFGVIDAIAVVPVGQGDRPVKMEEVKILSIKLVQ
jgi:Peptidyl-prolyl cis-trans isomerase (rotamase) - cyclophilin family